MLVTMSPKSMQGFGISNNDKEQNNKAGKDINLSEIKEDNANFTNQDDRVPNRKFLTDFATAIRSGKGEINRFISHNKQTIHQLSENLKDKEKRNKTMKDVKEVLTGKDYRLLQYFLLQNIAGIGGSIGLALAGAPQEAKTVAEFTTLADLATIILVKSL